MQLDGNPFSKSHWPLEDEEAIDWCKRISKISLDKGNKLKGSWRLTKEEGIGCMWKSKKECEEDWLLVLMCAKIKHGGNVCNNQA
jgi:hypothetical protein